MIDVSNLSQYSETGRKKQKDPHGNILPAYRKYVLRTLMSNCLDFRNEPSVMESLFLQLSETSKMSIALVTSPKYHCAIAGEGIEYNWGLTKMYYRNIPLQQNSNKEKINKCVTDICEYVTKQHSCLFATRGRRYMLAYLNLKANDLTLDSIERFVLICKSHWNVRDQDYVFITKVWKDSIELKGEN